MSRLQLALGKKLPGAMLGYMSVWRDEQRSAELPVVNARQNNPPVAEHHSTLTCIGSSEGFKLQVEMECIGAIRSTNIVARSL